jgi:hypothetical protein
MSVCSGHFNYKKKDGRMTDRVEASRWLKNNSGGANWNQDCIPPFSPLRPPNASLKCENMVDCNVDVNRSVLNHRGRKKTPNVSIVENSLHAAARVPVSACAHTRVANNQYTHKSRNIRRSEIHMH